MREAATSGAAVDKDRLLQTLERATHLLEVPIAPWGLPHVPFEVRRKAAQLCLEESFPMERVAREMGVGLATV